MTDSIPYRSKWFVESVDGFMHCLKGGPPFLVEYVTEDSVAVDAPVWVYDFAIQHWVQHVLGVRDRSLLSLVVPVKMLDLNSDDALPRFIEALSFPVEVAEIARVVAYVRFELVNEEVGLALLQHQPPRRSRTT